MIRAAISKWHAWTDVIPRVPTLGECVLGEGTLPSTACDTPTLRHAGAGRYLVSHPPRASHRREWTPTCAVLAAGESPAARTPYTCEVHGGVGNAFTLRSSDGCVDPSSHGVYTSMPASERWIWAAAR